MDPLLRVINLSKKFGNLHAVRQVSFDVRPGEVVGLAGSIGSGKSVLMMLLAGLYEPNQGDLYFANKRLEWPFQTQELGIGVIHQRPELVDRLNVTSNIFLGHELGWPDLHGWWKIPDRRKMDEEAARVLDQLDLKVESLHQPIANLSSEQRQMIAIARVLTYPVKMIIMDEPTILLSYHFQQKILALIQSWRKKGVAVVFSSNNLDHLFAVSDRIITLQQGRKVSDVSADSISRDEIVSMLVGYDKAEDPTPSVWALDSYNRAREQVERLRYYQMLLEKDLAAQDSLNQQLIAQLAEQLQTLDKANLALQDANRRLLTEREEERKHLARELHDQVIQDLLSVNYQLEEIAGQVAPELEADLSNVRENIRELVSDIRGICGTLRPPTIDSLGLGAALQSYARDWTTRTGIEATLNLDPNLGRLPEMIELSVFRIIQEGLNNVWRHAQASHVSLSLQHTSPRMLMISISDDGMGLPEDFDVVDLASMGHYGLLGVSERVALLGGRLRVMRQSKGGALLQVEIPHPRVEPVMV